MARTRNRLTEVGMTQPEWWVLHQLSLRPMGTSHNDLVAIIGPNDSDVSIVRAIEAGIGKGWIEHSDDRLTLTAAGTSQFRAAAEIQRQLNDERRQGISDRDYATAIEVLQRTAANVGSDAWHW